MRVLLLSGYDASSHRLWRQRLADLFPEYDWLSLALPPRHFNWRIRGNSLQWSLSEGSRLRESYDLLIATSMVDLASLRGFIPELSSIPTVVYFHENQFAYPQGQQRDTNVEQQLVPVYSALCADRIVFNSEFNRHTFIEGARTLFQRLPDIDARQVLEPFARSQVIPVPIPDTLRRERASTRPREPLQIVWNHRWEYDKGIDLLLALIREIHRQQLPYRMHIVGEQFRRQPEQFPIISDILTEHAFNTKTETGYFGYIDLREEYEQLLGTADVALSTALHDFQGLAIQEACVAGCTPLAPDKLVYPEYLERPFLYQIHPDVEQTVQSMIKQLQNWHDLKLQGRALPRADLSRYGADVVRNEYESLFLEMT